MNTDICSYLTSHSQHENSLYLEKINSNKIGHLSFFVLFCQDTSESFVFSSDRTAWLVSNTYNNDKIQNIVDLISSSLNHIFADDFHNEGKAVFCFVLFFVFVFCFCFLFRKVLYQFLITFSCLFLWSLQMGLK